MRVLAQKTQPQKLASSSAARSKMATFGPEDREHASLHLQRAMGDQAEQRMLPAHARAREVGLTSTPSAGFEYDFSRIPIHPLAPRAIQTKLAISKPEDEYEQEADRVAEQAMAALTYQAVSVPTSPLPKVADPSSQPRRPRSAINSASRDHAIMQVLGDGSEAVRRFGPPRAHWHEEAEARANEIRRNPPVLDFSRVRIHADGEADELASSLGVAAFTHGRDIYFRRGAWRPGSAVGDRVLAHELTHVGQQERSGVAAVQCYSDATILAELEQNIGEADTKAQQVRIERLAEIFNGLNMVAADDLLKRLNARKKGDRLAAEFHYRLSTKGREKLLGILEKTATTLPVVKYTIPADDPKYIDKVIEKVDFAPFLQGDRYHLIWKGGRTAVYKPDVDTTGKSKALPINQIQNSKTSALATAVEWRDDARKMGYDAVVTYYRSADGVILPTWISPETAPVTYDLMKGDSDSAKETAKAAYEFFRAQRNGLIFGAVLAGAFRIVGFIRGGGGGGGGTPPAVPKVEPPPGRAPDVPVMEPPAPVGEPARPGATEPPSGNRGGSPSRPPAQTIKASPPPPPQQTSRPGAPMPVTDVEVVKTNANSPASIKMQSPNPHQTDWTVRGGTGKAPAAYRDSEGTLHVSTDHPLMGDPNRGGIPPIRPAGNTPPARTPSRTQPAPSSTPTRSGSDIGLEDTGKPPAPAKPAVDPGAKTPPAAPKDAPVPKDAPTGGAAAESKRGQAPRGHIDPPQAVSREVVENIRNRPRTVDPRRKGSGSNVNYTTDHEAHELAWKRLGGHGDSPPAFIYDNQVYLDPSRWKD